MANKPGRNDPCPCGSEKKYKKCCYLTQINAPSDLCWQRVQKTHSGLIPKILDVIYEHYGPSAIHEAWEEFHLYDDSEFEENKPIVQIFMPWFFYNWVPDPEDTEVKKKPLKDTPPAATLLLTEKNRLNSFEKEYIESCCNRPYSFYEIKDSIVGSSIDVEDILTGERYTVYEKKGSQNAVPGSVFFGKIVIIQNKYYFDGLAPIQIPPKYKLQIINLRENIKKDLKKEITTEDLIELEGVFRGVFWSIWDAIMNPSPPIMTNTEGHLMIPHKIIYEIDSATKMFEALHELCFNTSKEDLLEDATFSEDGELTDISFPWLGKGNKKHETWDNTVLGHITITETKMEVDLNSKERAKKFKALLTKKIKTGWSLKATLIEPIESKLKQGFKKDDESESSDELTSEEIMALPEVQQHLETMNKSHWENWIDMPLPILSGLTPKKAAKTKVGKEKLEVLLYDFESKALNNPSPGQTVSVFKEIRKKLGL